MIESQKTCWILTEGIAGTENQCIGLAEALGMTPVIKRVKLAFPWKKLSPWLPFCHSHALAEGSDNLEPPYPDLLISSGRKSIGAALDVVKKSHGSTFHVHIQNPKAHVDKFDLVVAPQHDGLQGDNVITTRAALHRVTSKKIEDAKAKFQKDFSRLPHPRVAVLIGGSSKAHKMTLENTKALAVQLQQLVDHRKTGLMITASRRTGEENTKYLREQLQGPNIYFWDGTGDNPFFGILAMADYIIVTEDSVSMTSEALATGKPVYIASLEGGARRLDLFHKMLQEQGYTRPFTGMLEEWSYTPPDDTERAAAEVIKRMMLRANKCDLAR